MTYTLCGLTTYGHPTRFPLLVPQAFHNDEDAEGGLSRENADRNVSETGVIPPYVGSAESLLVTLEDRLVLSLSHTFLRTSFITLIALDGCRCDLTGHSPICVWKFTHVWRLISFLLD